MVYSNRGKRKTERSTKNRRLLLEERVELAKDCRHSKLRYRKRGTEAVCLKCGFVQILKSSGHRDVEVVTSWHLPRGTRLQALNSEALEYYYRYHIDKDTWDSVRQAAPLDAEHTCNHWDALNCRCTGACVCHWKPDAPNLE